MGEESLENSEVRKTVVVNAPPSMVWDALTNPDSIARWMHDSELTVTSDWRAGEAIVFRGNLHGIDFENKGTIRRFETEKAFEYDYWSTLSASKLPDAPENYTTVSFQLAPTEAGTVLALTLSDFPDASVYHHAKLYWGVTLDVLKAFCEEHPR
ncbi:SRPBCC domain-containing protein [Pendulispora brunnea]|uniref:SRPBCC domain-containing protein n=1 Tax=Pendulispora brunnea TaxID=2905690 RepID=A0ABZ2KEG1_9BACT